MADFVHIWCDGSYRPARHSIGAAWVRAVGGVVASQAIPLPRLQDGHAHGSDYAELTAFALALDAAEADKRVVVHMDCRAVIDWLSSGRVNCANKRQQPRIMQAFARAMTAKARMKSVEIIYTSDRNSENMGLAHALSRRASTPA